MKLNLTRPLVFFDLETTGTNVTHDRVVEISAIKVLPDGTEIEYTRRVNPGMHIPEAASAVHHITDTDVAAEPTFREIAAELFSFFEGCDIAGFNSNKFDIPLLVEEFTRAGQNFDLVNRRLVDVQNIYHKMEPRTLVAAYRYYCGKDLENAHSATSDTRATLEVLKSQLDRYDSLKNDVDYLSEFSRGKEMDLAGRIVRNDRGVPIFNFGKHKGKPVEEVLRTEPSFFAWMLNSDFSKNTKDVLLALKYQYTSSSK